MLCHHFQNNNVLPKTMTITCTSVAHAQSVGLAQVTAPRTILQAFKNKQDNILLDLHMAQDNNIPTVPPLRALACIPLIASRRVANAGLPCIWSIVLLKS